MKNIIVTSGKDYVGAYVLKLCKLKGFNPITIDNLSMDIEYL